MSWALGMAVIQNGVEVRPSLLGGDSGDGLFALKDFEVDSLVTFYDGSLKQVAKVSGKYDGCVMETSHCMSVRGHDLVIQGVSRRFGNCVGRGGASFANHSSNAANAKFVHTRFELEMFCEDDFVNYTIGAIVLKATKNISAGEEILVNYGSQFNVTLRGLGK